VAGAAVGTGAAVDGVAATDTEVDTTVVVDFTALGITASTVAGAGSLAAIFPGGSRFQFRFPIRGTADTVTDTAGGRAMGTGILVQAMATAAETQIKATQNRQGLLATAQLSVESIKKSGVTRLRE